MDINREQGLNIQLEPHGKGGIKPTIVEGSRRPKDGKTYTWKPIHGNEMKRDVITGWAKVSTVSNAPQPNAQHFDFTLGDFPKLREDQKD